MNAISPISIASSQLPTAEQRLVALAENLAPPVANRLLAINQAEACLLCASLRAARAGAIEVDPVRFSDTLQHILRLNVQNITVQRMITGGAIRRAIGPYIGIRAHSHRILQVAHETNSRAGHPLRGDEVSEVASLEMFAAMQAAAGDR